ncbi:glycosyl transferase family protein [Pseudomonas chlororaphis subsp. aurantiaca]|uniref:biosynthetic peptidoglycan transglycosylase n=1 Tax=Pseudomonas chlororaphis TaxID=587753 RepID=UPI000865F501|nr:biosynthetic peptidoglycan transglycosylase [Pseudomonas chlororaphis]BAV73942.1 glycosyl transferase family protein [Pseudomonas chlororaphis subsp. aurantiaca]
MWAKAFQRASFRIFTLPVYFGISVVRLIGYSSVLKDFDYCIGVIKGLEFEYADEVTASLIRALVVAEDHRNLLHSGVDPIAIVRALKVRMLEGKRQGASTIEQQLVRTLTKRYERTPRRKVREQILAVMICGEFTKRELAASYLKVAYYGAALKGGDGVRKLRKDNCEWSDEVIVAHLKYPRSSRYADSMSIKHRNRVEHIRFLLKGEVGVFLRKSIDHVVVPSGVLESSKGQ